MNGLDRRIQSVFRDVFDDDELEVKDWTSAKDVHGWDSFMQVKLVLELEESFQIKFTTHDVAEMKCVGDLKAALIRKGASTG